MYKNRVKNNRKLFEIPAFYLSNEEIQSGKIQNNICNFEFSHSSGFPHSQDKRMGVPKIISVFLYILIFCLPTLDSIRNKFSIFILCQSKMF